MNERIRKLAEQSYEATTVTTIDPVTQEVVVDFIDGTKPFFNQEKFAELIVKECAQVCLSGKNKENWRCTDSINKGFSDAVLDHFGVEE